MHLQVFRFPHGDFLPSYGTSDSAGMDLYSADDLFIEPMQIALVRTGIGIILPVISDSKISSNATQNQLQISLNGEYKYEAQIRSRSGLAFNHGVIVLNSPGTIDADYHDEIKVILMNLGSKVFELKKGMRVAQMVVSCCAAVVLNEVSYESVESLVKNRGGFGSTGV
jgi:dUTP pyrophosphatase